MDGKHRPPPPRPGGAASVLFTRRVFRVGGGGVAQRWTAIGKRGQALKGVRWMSWHREATKDAAACDKPREAGKRALIRGCPNRETEPHDLRLPPPECIGRRERTRGTETSQY